MDLQAWLQYESGFLHQPNIISLQNINVHLPLSLSMNVFKEIQRG